MTNNDLFLIKSEVRLFVSNFRWPLCSLCVVLLVGSGRGDPCPTDKCFKEDQSNDKCEF